MNKIVTLIRTRKYLYGNNILAHGNFSKYIMIILDGQIQVRVQRGDYLNNKEEMDIWFATLEIGACFNVYNCFSKSRTTRVTYIASSKVVTVGLIKVSDLKALSQENQNLYDTMKKVKLKVEENLVDEIDFFTFPKKYLEPSSHELTDE